MRLRTMKDKGRLLTDDTDTDDTVKLRTLVELASGSLVPSLFDIGWVRDYASGKGHA